MQHISAKEIEQWAERIDSTGDLPWVVRRLIRYSCHVSKCDMPDGEQVTIGGYDGEVEVLDNGFENLVPPGRSVWELSTEKGIHKKANNDYHTRTNNNAENRKGKTTFVFATPRHWKKRDEWAQEKTAEGVWREVLGLNSRSLQSWLETAPAIASMFWSRCLRRDPWGLATTEMIWDDCSRNVDVARIREPAIDCDFIVAGRQDEALAIEHWLTSVEESTVRGILRVFAPSMTEAEHFVAAVVSSLPKEQRERLYSSMVWIKSDIGADQIASLPSTSTLVATSANTNRAIELQRRHGCRVILIEEGEPEIQPAPDTVVVRPVVPAELTKQLVRLGCCRQAAMEACAIVGSDYLQIRRIVFFTREGGAS